MPRRKNGTRVLGPYPYRDKFRLFLCDEAGAKSARIFDTEREAKAVKASLERELEKLFSLTLAEALAAYEEFGGEKAAA